MTDNETRPQCRAELHLSWSSAHYRCTLVENHAGEHQDLDGDSWDITYVDEPQCPVTTDGGTFRCSQRQWHEGPHTIQLLASEPQAAPVDIRVRPVQDQLTALTARVGLLEADRACAPVYLTEPGKEQGDYLHGRTHGDLIKELYQRLNELEAAPARGERCTWVSPAARLCVLTAGRGTDHLTAVEDHGDRDPKAVLIDPVELGRLLEASERLSALEAAGVDNWEGHGHAVQIMRERSND